MDSGEKERKDSSEGQDLKKKVGSGGGGRTEQTLAGKQVRALQPV
jgi:hypothetical protein